MNRCSKGGGEGNESHRVSGVRARGSRQTGHTPEMSGGLQAFHRRTQQQAAQGGHSHEGRFPSSL